MVCLLLPGAASGAGGWSAPEVLSPTAGMDPGSLEIHALPLKDLSPSHVLPQGGYLATYTQDSRLYALELDDEGVPGVRRELAGAVGELSDLTTGYRYITEQRVIDDEVVDVSELRSITFSWLSTAPDGSSRVMSGSLAVDGTVGPVVQRSETLAPPNAISDPSVAVGTAGDLGFTWREQVVGSGSRVAARIVDKDGNSTPILYPAEPIGDATSPGIASTTAGGYRVAWIQQTPQGKNIITASYNASGELKLYKPVPGVPSDPKQPPRPEFDYDRYAILKPVSEMGSGVVGDPSDLHVWSQGPGLVRLTWTRTRTEGGQTQRVVEAAGYSDGAVYWVDPRPAEVEPPLVPGSPDNRLLVFDRLTPMNREFSDLSIVSSGDVRTWAFRAVEHGKNWIMGGTVKPGGALSVRVRDQHDTAVAGSKPQAGMNSRDAVVVTWTDPVENRSWGSYIGSRSKVALAQPLAAPGANLSSPKGFVNEEGIPIVVSDSDDGGSPVARVSRYFDPRAEILTPYIRFGRQRVGDSYTTGIYLTNGGTSRSKVNGISFSANDGQFALLDPTACVGDLVAGGSCSTLVRFTPTVAGSASATVSVDTDAGLLEAEITGSGIVHKALKLGLAKRSFKIRAGRTIRLNAIVRNAGGAPVAGTKVCVSGGRRFVRPARRCVSLGSVGTGVELRRRLTVKVRNRAAKGLRLVKVTVSGNGVLTRKKMVKVRVR